MRPPNPASSSRITRLVSVEPDASAAAGAPALHLLQGLLFFGFRFHFEQADQALKIVFLVLFIKDGSRSNWR